MPKVSVIVPVYNVARFLPQCLDSIRGQTMKDLEIICVNDGSTDESLSILREYASQDERISVIDKENAGYGHTMNVGMQQARGEYIGILESDDFTDMNMFEQLYQAAAAFKADIVKSNYWEYREGRKTFVKMLKEGPYDEVFNPRQDNISVFYNQPAIWTAIYRRIFLENNKILFNETPGASYQDTSFNFMALACAERMVLKEEAYVCYRRDNESSSVNSAGKVYCVLDEYENSRAFLKSRKNLGEGLGYVLAAISWHTSQWNYNRIAFQFKYDFLERLLGIYYDLWNAGEIRPQYWQNKAYLEDVVHIMLNRNSFLHETYCLFQKMVFLKDAFESKIKLYEKVHLYGAGKIGQEVAMYLKENDIDFDGFIVGDMTGNLENVLGKNVISLNELSEPNVSNSLVLLSVKESIQKETMPILRKQGFKNILVITKEMRDYFIQIPKYDIHQLACCFMKKQYN